MSSCLRPCRVHPIYRAIASSRSHNPRVFSFTCRTRQQEPAEPVNPEELAEAAVDPEDPGELDAPSQEPVERSYRDDGMYTGWLQSEGRKWKEPDPLGPKWLGGAYPFPLNPTFTPPTPVSDGLRTTIYTSHMAKPRENDIHTLSTRYGIAVKRIEAIIRLKDLEEQWKKSKPLQTGFLKGMERMLGINRGGRIESIADETRSPTRAAVNAADEVSRQATEQGRDRKRGISRTYFEPVDEDKDPVVPDLLDTVQKEARMARAQQPQYPINIVQPDPSKPAFKFVDVGLRWVDQGDVERRQKESARRRRVKDTKKGKRVVPAAAAL